MIGAYSSGLVFLSFAVAVLASYTALDLVQRISMLQAARHRHFWLAGGALAMGIGVWSMHFLGMLAFSLPIQVGYDIWYTLLSLAMSVAVSWFALHSVTRASLSRSRLVVGGVFMGLGISVMHYAGMTAMMIQPDMQYDPREFSVSVLIAVCASIVALWTAFTLRGKNQVHAVLSKLGAALLMGFAITGTHYTGMAAAQFAPGSISLAGHVDNAWLTTSIAGLTFSVLTIALIMSVLDARLELQTSRLADSLKNANDQLMYLVTHDQLTDLPNRVLLTDRIQRAIHAARRSERPCAVIYLNLDGFKPVNDSLGHPAGDALLRSVAERLFDLLRREDTLARVGGDEFAILIEDLNQPEDAMDMCERILGAMRQPMDVGVTMLHMTASIGIAVFPTDGKTVESLMQNADAAMNEVKKGGRNGYRFFERTMNANALRTLRIQADLRRALEHGELSLHFQPKFNAQKRNLIGAEALIRWEHPELGWIDPAEFIPVAERSGLILEIGEWVIREACGQLVAWRDAGLDPVKVAVNLSARQLRVRGLPEQIAAIVGEYGLDPKLLMLEITETAAMEDAEVNVEIVHRLQELGFDVAIDDFGTGYSSLSYLQKFRVRQLKVDRFFIDGLDSGGAEGAAIVSAIIALAHSLQMEVVAEGVETGTQLEHLNRLACDQFQGFLLGRPMPAQAFGGLLVTHPAGAEVVSRPLPDEVSS